MVLAPGFLSVITLLSQKPYWILKGWLHFAIFRTPLFSLKFFNGFVFKCIVKTIARIDPGRCVGILYTEYNMPVNKNHGQFILASAKIPMQYKEATNMPCPTRQKTLKKSRQFRLDENLGEGLPGENPNSSGDYTGIRETRWIEYGISSIGQPGKITSIVGNITGINFRKYSSILLFRYNILNNKHVIL